METLFIIGLVILIVMVLVSLRPRPHRAASVEPQPKLSGYRQVQIAKGISDDVLHRQVYDATNKAVRGWHRRPAVSFSEPPLLGDGEIVDAEVTDVAGYLEN